MKRFFSYILIVAVMVGVFSPTLTYAQNSGPAPIPTNTNPAITNQPPSTGATAPEQNRALVSCEYGYGGVVLNAPCRGTALLDSGKIIEQEKPSSEVDADGCGIAPWTWGSCIIKWAAMLSYEVVLKICALILWMAGMILDFVIKYTIIDMAKHVAEMSGINIAWKVLRDLMNIAFIFLLLYEAITLIIGQSTLQKVKNFVTYMVLAALLINFSLFFTKVMIDASNVITIGFYNSIIDSSDNLTTGVPGTERREVGGLSVPFMRALNLANFYGNGSFESMTNQLGSNTNLLIFALLGSVLFIVVAFVFFAIACIFTVRYATLIILLMLSPVAYMGDAIPGMAEYSKEWWNTLTGQLIFAPIYMLMTWVVLILMSSPGFISRDGNWAQLIANQSDPAATTASLSLLFNFAIIIVLAIATLVVSKKMASKGSAFVGQAIGNVTSFAGGAMMGGASKIGRNTVGRLGDAVVGSERMKNLAFKKGANGEMVARSGFNGFVTRGILKSGDSLAKSTFDVRSAGQFKNVAKMAGVNFGTGADFKKVNYQKDLEAKGVEAANFAKLLKPSDSAVAEAENKEDKKQREIQNDVNSQIKVKEVEGAALNERTTELNNQRMSLNSEKSALEKDLAAAVEIGDETERDAINAQIKAKEDEIKIHEEGMKAHEKNIKENEAQVKRLNELMTKSKETAKEAGNLVKNRYAERAQAYAKSFSEEGPLMTWSKNVLKGASIGTVAGAGVIAGAAGPAVAGAAVAGVAMGGFRTTSQNKSIARKIIKDTKAKTPKEEFDEAAKKYADAEAKAKKEADEAAGKSGGETDKPTEPKPTA